jgi:hypothetical protein
MLFCSLIIFLVDFFFPRNHFDCSVSLQVFVQEVNGLVMFELFTLLYL